MLDSMTGKKRRLNVFKGYSGKKRTRMEIIADILRIISWGVRNKSELMRKANLNTAVMYGWYAKLESAGLIEGLEITEKGLEVIELWEKMYKYLEGVL